MSHARIEEVSDSDPSEGDISEVESDFDERDILKQVGPRPSQVPAPQASSSSLINPSAIPSTAKRETVANPDGAEYRTAVDESIYSDYQCLYPVYFDITRTRKQGRRVGKELAVENPMAREIVAACSRLRLEALFEPTKIHPKDWSNPGRVKIKLKGGRRPDIKNKHHLYTIISEHLKANPTTIETATKVRVPGMPPPDATKPYPEPAIPKGWKMNKILPYYSPGLTGGGVSENFLKDMMAEMQAGGGPGGPGGAGMPDMSALQSMMGGMGGMGGGGGGAPGPSSGAAKKEKKKKIKG